MKSNRFNKYPALTLLLTIFLLLIFTDILMTKVSTQILNKFKKYKSNQSLGIRHPVYHHTFKPNKKIKRTHSKKSFGKDYIFYSNSLGFKDSRIRDISLETDDYRILFIGDSFTEGLGLSYEETFVGIIDSTLKNKNISILNAGKVSYSPIIYWRKIKYLIENIGLKFNEVVVYVDISDAYNEAISYSLDEELNVQYKTKSERRDEDNEERIKVKIKTNLKTKLYIFLKQNTTVIFKAIKYFYRQFGFSEKQPKTNPWSSIIEKNSISDEWNLIVDKWTIDKQIQEDWGDEGNEKNILYMNKLLNLLNQNNIKLTLAVYPWPSQIYYDDINSLHIRIWEDWCSKNKVDFINYFPLFFNLKLDNERKLDFLKKYFFPYDVHFNKNGNRFIADEFLKFFSQKSSWSMRKSEKEQKQNYLKQFNF